MKSLLHIVPLHGFRLAGFVLLVVADEGALCIPQGCHVDVPVMLFIVIGEYEVVALVGGKPVHHVLDSGHRLRAVAQHQVPAQQGSAAVFGVVMDGRDIGTTILPNAEVKIYLTASADTRAKRRALEYEQKGEPFDLNQIRKDIIERDERDMNREISPLKQADDAVLVDSSEMGIDDVVNAILDVYNKKVKK